MNQVTQGTMTFKGERIKYFRVDFKQLEVMRLGASPSKAAAEFNEFRHSTSLDRRPVICVREHVSGSIPLPSVFWFSDDRSIQYLDVVSGIQARSGAYLRDYLGESSALEPCLRGLLRRLKHAGDVSITFPQEDDREFRSEPIMVGKLDILANVIEHTPRAITASSAYSIVNVSECRSPFESIRDPIGLRCSGGNISSAAGYTRPIFMQTASRSFIENCGITEMSFRVCGLEQHGWLGRRDSTDKFKIYGPNSNFLHTPNDPQRVDLVVIEDRIRAVVKGGGSVIPYSGFVISADRETITSDIVCSISREPKLGFRIKEYDDLVSGIQCGPSLIRNGELLDQSVTLVEEQFCVLRGGDITAPTSLNLSIGQTRAARSAIGTTVDGCPVFIVVPGTNTSSSRTSEHSSYGATFEELAHVAFKEGLHDAIAMDSGGSVGLWNGPEAIFKGGDFRPSRRTLAERPLANALRLI